MVQQQFRLDPFTNTLFLFCGRRRDRVKALYWEGNGFVLLYKRLEQEKPVLDDLLAWANELMPKTAGKSPHWARRCIICWNSGRIWYSIWKMAVWS